ncbi:MAG: glucosamine-6-phosphate deaminase [Clostridia bacterium]|nr:glucosamine-6-phosphate deaminase [Clostridia bacterium]
MKIVCCNDYREMSRVAADIVADVVKNKPNCVLGLATGSTPEGMYAELIAKYQGGELDFSAVTTVNLDEYYPITPDNEQSYRYFMNTKLFDHVNVDKANTHVPNGNAEDAAAEAARYEAFVRELGGADIQVLGIGRNGHIAFNEPAEALYPATHVTELTADTVEANARFFESIDQVPTLALTMGMGTILSAKKIIILANGKGKHEAVKTMLAGMVTTTCPATFLGLHADVTLICDTAAYEG